jgi:endonuclease/exonuclease/phosphatase family metal-dependent hydrolase
MLRSNCLSIALSIIVVCFSNILICAAEPTQEQNVITADISATGDVNIAVADTNINPPLESPTSEFDANSDLFGFNFPLLLSRRPELADKLLQFKQKLLGPSLQGLYFDVLRERRPDLAQKLFDLERDLINEGKAVQDADTAARFVLEYISITYKLQCSLVKIEKATEAKSKYSVILPRTTQLKVPAPDHESTGQFTIRTTTVDVEVPNVTVDTTWKLRIVVLCNQQELKVHARVSTDMQKNTAVTEFMVPESSLVASSLSAIIAGTAAAHTNASAPDQNAIDSINRILELIEADSVNATHQSFKGVHGCFKIANANIWNYNLWDLRRNLLRADFAQINADIIGFQEVRARKRSGDSNQKSRYQVADLVNILGSEYHYVYQPAMGFNEGPQEFVHEGLAIFSKYPILERRVLYLTRDKYDTNDFHQRICLSALVQTPRGQVNFMTTHLSLSHEARIRSLREIGVYSKTLNVPSILVGDFNAELEDDGIDIDFMRESNFVDVWRQLRSHDSRAAGFTFPSWETNKRIDYVFMRNPEVDANADNSPSSAQSSSIRLAAKYISVEGAWGVPLPPGQYVPLVGGVRDYFGKMMPSDHLFLAASMCLVDK